MAIAQAYQPLSQLYDIHFEYRSATGSQETGEGTDAPAAAADHQ